MSLNLNLKANRIPAVEDPSWEQLSQPVFDFLSVPRNWKDLHGWSREVRYNGTRLRHALAWLEHVGKVTSFFREEPNSKGHLRPKLYWASWGWIAARTVDLGEVTSPDTEMLLETRSRTET